MNEPVRIGDTLEGIQARISQVRATQRAAGRVPPPTLVKCMRCSDCGFESVSTDGHGTVRLCPNGCKPPKPRQVVQQQVARRPVSDTF